LETAHAPSGPGRRRAQGARGRAARQRLQGLFLFGSVGRGEERAGSDVDLFFDHRSGLGLEIVAIQERVREIVAGEVDVTTRKSLHPRLRERIVASAVRVF
jgi:hypothetical protein